jgi:inhibitor of KinA
MPQPPFTISPLGDAALIISFGNKIDENINRKVYTFSRLIKEARINGIYDIVPAYSSIAVHYNPIVLMMRSLGETAYESLKKQLQLLPFKDAEEITAPIRKLRIPVCYAARFGWDLEYMSGVTNLPVADIVRLHTSCIYKVYMIGFLPGFAYMGEVDERIAVARKTEPRLQIEQGYVGIAGKQTGIYPLTSPGGWQIIGRTPLLIFDKQKEKPALFAPGDEVEFFSISEDEFENY